MAVLEVARAIQDASEHGLSMRALDFSYLYSCPEGMRMDPLGVLALPGEPAVGPIPPLLDLLERISPYRGTADEARLVSFIQRWRHSAARLSLQQFIEELEPLVPGDTTHVVVHPAPEVDVTLPLPAVPYLAAAAAPIGHPRPSRTASWGPSPSMVGFFAATALVCGAVLLGMSLGSAAGFGPRLQQEQPTEAAATAGEPAAPSTHAAALKVTAQEPSPVRVTVDGAVVFEGELKPGESKEWGGNHRVQLWTNKGKTLKVHVNGHDIGALAPAVGHPDWNTVDWGWPAGWKPAGR